MDARYTILYTVLKASDEGELASKVRAHLTDGWKLQGGVSIAVTGITTVWMAQAMVKEMSNKEMSKK